MTQDMQAILEKQRKSFVAALPEAMSVRRDRIDRAIALLIDNAEAFAKAVSADFGCSFCFFCKAFRMLILI